VLVALNQLENIRFYVKKRNISHELDTRFFVHKRIISAVNRVEFLSDRITNIILGGRWCHMIILNVHAPIEDNILDMNGSFYNEVERVFDKFLNTI
jgi:hypothetical protein